MLNPHTRHLAVLLACLGLVIGSVTGCEDDTPPPKPVEPYPTLPPKANVPDFMIGTIWERTDVSNITPFAVSGYGLVVNLQHTGDSLASARVRNYIVKQIETNGWGGLYGGPDEQVTPDTILHDNRVAIVAVDGFIPPGARKGQMFDIRVSVIRGNNTKSLAHGQVYDTELRWGGSIEPDSGGEVLAMAHRGPVFVNPAYALSSKGDASGTGVKSGVVQESGEAMKDRPIFLHLRTPERRLSRSIEVRINDRFQELHHGDLPNVAQAEDEGIVQIFVPDEFEGDWQHFLGVATHLYLNAKPEFAAQQTETLVNAALKPNAPLMDISYCLEGLGSAVVPLYASLITSSQPDVAYAAARAAAFAGDAGAVTALTDIARTPGHPFRLAAIETLGQLPMGGEQMASAPSRLLSPEIADCLRSLLNSQEALVRLAAYRVLADHRDASILSTAVNDEFMLDEIDSPGEPMIYATREGMPRIAIFGSKVDVTNPVAFLGMDQRLTIASVENSDMLEVYFRPPAMSEAVKFMVKPGVSGLVQRLGDISRTHPGTGLDLSYGDVVAILQEMSNQKELLGAHNGEIVSASFVLQDISSAKDSIYAAPSLEPESRPQGGAPAALEPTTLPLLGPTTTPSPESHDAPGLAPAAGTAVH